MPEITTPRELAGIPNLILIDDFVIFHRNATNLPVVYFLCDGEEIVYVGQTKFLNKRIRQHGARKKFSHLYCYACSSEKLMEEEWWWIKKLRPKYNQQGVRRFFDKKQCQWVGCDKVASRGIKFCGQHSANMRAKMIMHGFITGPRIQAK